MWGANRLAIEGLPLLPVTPSVVSHYFDAEFFKPLALRKCRSGCRIGGYLTLSGCRGTLRVPQPTPKIVQRINDSGH